MTPGLDNLHIITSGRIPSNPAELIDSKRLSEFIQDAKKHYHLVVIDTPPILSTADPATVGRISDAVLLVYRVGSISRRLLKRASDQLTQVHAKLVGVVLNGLRPAVSPDFEDFKYYKYWDSPKGKGGKKGKAAKARKKKLKTPRPATSRYLKAALFLIVVGLGAYGLWKAGYLPLEQYYDQAIGMWEKRAPGSPEKIRKTSEPVKKPISKTPRRTKQVPSPTSKNKKQANLPEAKKRSSRLEAANRNPAAKPIEVSMVKTAAAHGKTMSPKTLGTPSNGSEAAKETQEAKSGDREAAAPSKPVRHPYTVHAGSFRSMDSVKKATAVLERKGLSPYWTRVNLGEKGVWYRVYVGSFENAQEAERFQKRQKLSSSRVLKTNYGVQVGQFSSRTQIGQKLSELQRTGFSPYVIENSSDQSRVLVGAYVSRMGAEEMAHTLQKDGVACQVVLR
jgi:cell division protein FtsN